MRYLKTNPWDSASLIWILTDETTPVYAVQPDGPYALQTYERLVTFFEQQLGEAGVERVSIPGRVGGEVRLFTGQTLPVIHPELRGMFSWTTAALVDSVCGPKPAVAAEQAAFDERSTELRSFLDQVYYGLRNAGLTPQERAMNYAATNAWHLQKTFEQRLNAKMALDTIEVERSPFCRPDSDCWDVKLVFFKPDQQFEVARKVSRFTVDVSDTVPVLVGRVREWSVR